MLRKIVCLAALLLMLSLPALAVNDGCRAWPNQKLHFRTGPNTAYTDLYVLPQSTQVYAIEYEEGNDVTWVLCEFESQGRRVRGYTGLKRFTLDRSLSWASHYNLERRVVNDGEVYAAPDDTSQVRARVRAGDRVTFLDFEGDYCFIEYRRSGERERGYVHAFSFWVDEDEYAEWFPDNTMDTIYAVRGSCPMYESASENSRLLFNIPYDRCVAVYPDSWASSGWVRIYYGGVWGYGKARDFNDLRGYVEPER